jgi:putative spermidine/putrescine transport system ATP-binding protein
VASFVGTVNQLDAVVVSAAEGTVSCGDRVMTVDGDLSEHPAGSEVAVYLRPEDVELVSEGAADRDASPGKVRSLTFLGPVTRVGVDCGLGQLVADVASDVALRLGVGDPVAVVVEPGRLRTLANPQGT